MSKVYLVAFDGSPDIRGAVTQFFDSHAEITDWHRSMFNTLFLVTDLDAAALRDLLRTGPLRRFVVAEIDTQSYNKSVSGMLPRATWDFIRRRQPAE